MARVFLSHAHEDVDAVEAVYAVLRQRLPQHAAWMDRYEIVGGEDLLGKIAAGMDEADKFFVFLSPSSVEKPWVQAELRRALMREITGVDPAFIVPVKLGDLRIMPAFLEHKLYIDLSAMTVDEWVAAFEASITGNPTMKPGSSENVRIRIEPDPDGPHAVRIVFEAIAWAEEFSFAVQTTADLELSHLWEGGAFSNVSEVREPRVFAMRFETPRLSPGRSFSIRLVFAAGVDAASAIGSISRWQPVA